MVKVYDLLGRKIATLVDEMKPAGAYAVTWNAGKLASGVYFYSIRAGQFTAVRKMLLIK